MRGRIAAPAALLATALTFTATAAAQTGGRSVTSQTAITGAVPAWSPNGNQIAFADLAGSSWGVYVVGADGRGRRLVATAGRDAPKAISWSPNGARLAYDAFDAGDQLTDVFTVAASGGTPTKITSGWEPSWGPQNKLLIIDRGADRGDDRTFVVNPDGTGKQELEPCAEFDFGGCFDGDPDWSKDGKRVAFDTVMGAGSAIWTMDPDGTNRRTLTPFFPAAAHPRWSPDGATILYEHFDIANPAGGDVSVMNANGSASHVVAKNGKSPDWSPDGKTIVFSRAGTSGDSLYLVNPDGSNERPLVAAGTPPPAANRCVVPKVVGKTVAAARALLTRARCKVGKITHVKSKTVAKGRVASSNPKAGTVAPAGTAVALAVSRGRK